MPPLDPKDQRIADLEALVEKLMAKIADIEARLAANSTNSSSPPSADGPGVERPKKDRTGRRRGAQPGHKGHKRELLPPEKVTRTVECVPTTCDHCSEPLDGADPDPYRRQIVDLPRIEPDVTEVRVHALTCACCGKVTRGRAPEGLPRGAFGPRLIAVIALLTGKMGASKRAAREFVSDVLGVDLCLGSVSKAESIIADALAPATEEAREYVRNQTRANLDESGWREDKARAWIWIATTALVAVFVIARSRGSQVARSMLGPEFNGIVGSDRWSAYTWLPLEQRQICWAHLLRDFQGMADRGGPGGAIGEALLGQSAKIFRWWAEVRDGTLPFERFQKRMRPVEREIGELLCDGEVCSDARVSGMCAEILKVESALWTFVRTEGIEPTNNLAERDLRRAVLWRKGCFGTDSENGSRYAERILTTTTTLRKQKRHVLDFLAQSVDGMLRGTPRPSLLPQTVASVR